MIELYELTGLSPAHSFSPYCWRIRMALAHKGLTAKLIGWHFGEKKLPRGQTKVPVLVDDGEVIADSSAIAVYLEETYETGPSLFGGPAGEAHARFIAAWTDTVLTPMLFPLVVPDMPRHVKPAAQAYFRETREARLGMTLEEAADTRDAKLPAFRAALAPLRRALDSQEYLGGEEPSYADYIVFGSFQWARLVSPYQILDETDTLQPWLTRMLDLFDGLARDAKGV